MLATKEDILQIYRRLLGREADDIAYEYWLPRIREHNITPHQLTEIALSSDEYRLRHPGEVPKADQFESLVAAAEQRVAGLGAPGDAIQQLDADTNSWFHSFRLSDGTTVNGIKPLQLLESEFDAVFGPLSLSGCSVLDIGAWNGAFSFEAKRRGADRVLAVDMYTWVHWGWRGLEKFLYVRKDRGANVDYKLLDVADVSQETVGMFNVVLFLGVLYHLHEPISIIDRLWQIADPWLILETYLDLPDVPYPAMRFYPNAELVGDPTNWWGPNRACVEELLRTAGFSEVRFTPNPVAPQHRGIFHARK
jgi:tRNA (mo5U34)-methyltransferase